jgi:hypothetical protein
VACKTSWDLVVDISQSRPALNTNIYSGSGAD